MVDERTWPSIGILVSKSYICGYCGEYISSNMGFSGKVKTDINIGYSESIYVCHSCGCPTFFDYDENQFPGEIYGIDIKDAPSSVAKLYNEARECYSVKAYTASIMCTRKIIMNVAVDKGAPKGKKYVEYVRWLDSEGYLPQGSKVWVDRIRDKGNEANHEIVQMNEEDAKLMIDFVEMLLKLIYEYPAKAEST